jgi:hypothetical protein
MLWSTETDDRSNVISGASCTLPPECSEAVFDKCPRTPGAHILQVATPRWNISKAVRRTPTTNASHRRLPLSWLQTSIGEHVGESSPCESLFSDSAGPEQTVRLAPIDTLHAC